MLILMELMKLLMKVMMMMILYEETPTRSETNKEEEGQASSPCPELAFPFPRLWYNTILYH